MDYCNLTGPAWNRDEAGMVPAQRSRMPPWWGAGSICALLLAAAPALSQEIPTIRICDLPDPGCRPTQTWVDAVVEHGASQIVAGWLQAADGTWYLKPWASSPLAVVVTGAGLDPTLGLTRIPCHTHANDAQAIAYAVVAMPAGTSPPLSLPDAEFRRWTAPLPAAFARRTAPTRRITLNPLPSVWGVRVQGAEQAAGFTDGGASLDVHPNLDTTLALLPCPGPNWEVTVDWDASTSTALPESWGAAVGGGGWGNQELQYYTGRDRNLTFGPDGMTITAQAEDPEYLGYRYTSARLSLPVPPTDMRVQVVAELPAVNGAWPAIWLLGPTQTIPWPGCGEIDLIEQNGAFACITGIAGLPADPTPLPAMLPVGLTGGPHTFGLERTAGLIIWSIDGQPVRVAQSWRTASYPAPLTDAAAAPWSLILNLAIGGTFCDGAAPPTDSFPLRLTIRRVTVAVRRPSSPG